MVAEATGYMQTRPIIATGHFAIGGLAAAMRRCCLIITNDSGPMHVAISQKVPIVAMYGPSNPKLYGPYTKDAVIVTAQPPCQGCADGMKHSCDDLQCCFLQFYLRCLELFLSAYIVISLKMAVIGKLYSVCGMD